MMSELNNLFHFERQRLNNLFAEAVKYPLVVVCAGAGYGKTSAIYDFVKKAGASTAWIQLSERDNVGARFWENYIHSIAQANKPFAHAIGNLGFPDSDDKLNQYFRILQNSEDQGRRIVIVDDFHLIEDPAVLRFLERAAQNIPPGASVFLLSRVTPNINIASKVSGGLVYNINEDELLFTEEELAQYFRQLEIVAQPGDFHKIIQDTEGWAFAINLVARSYRKAPGYEGYLRSAMRTNIFQLMESAIWSRISERLSHFLIRLSLIDHLSVDLIEKLAKGDNELIAELERQHAYFRRDDYINAYLIHNLFLEFLGGKKDLLTEEQKRETYEIAADWCDKNGFKIDALAYYEKVGDYESIIRIFFELPTQVPQDIARYAAGIFERAPAEAFDRVGFIAVMHVRAIMCLGRLDEALRLMRSYEEKYIALPADDAFRNHMLGGIYYCWAITRTLMCTTDDRYDFDEFYAKMDDCLTRSPSDPGPLANHPCGPWISLVGASLKGAPQKFIESFSRATGHAAHCMNGAMTGLDDLARGELDYYRGDVRAAEAHFVRGLERASEHRQFETVHRAYFYLLRIAIYHGNFEGAEETLKDMQTLLEENEYSARFITYDIALAWYYCFLDMPEKAPDWLREKFTPYGHAYFIENFGNQAKARYCYRTKNYPILLAYIEEQQRRESILFGRVEMLAIEACMYYKMKERAKAFASLKQAYDVSAPNDIMMPFIELGKDMRTLTAAAMKEKGCGVPEAWLEEAGRKAASYAKRQASLVNKYKRTNHIKEDVVISQREMEILTDLSHGMSRKEIAAYRNISVNTVKMMIGAIYDKLGAENLADLIRIATERRMI